MSIDSKVQPKSLNDSYSASLLGDTMADERIKAPHKASDDRLYERHWDLLHPSVAEEIEGTKEEAVEDYQAVERGHFKDKNPEGKRVQFKFDQENIDNDVDDLLEKVVVKHLERKGVENPESVKGDPDKVQQYIDSVSQPGMYRHVKSALKNLKGKSLKKAREEGRLRGSYDALLSRLGEMESADAYERHRIEKEIKDNIKRHTGYRAHVGEKIGSEFEDWVEVDDLLEHAGEYRKGGDTFAREYAKESVLADIKKKHKPDFKEKYVK